MFVLNKLDDVAFDTAQINIGYAKLFPHLVEDFITREDMKEILKPNNLPVNTTVNTVVAGTAVPGTPVTGTGIGTGNGTTNPIYNGSIPSPGTIALKVRQESIKDNGGVVVKATIGSV